MNAYNILTVIAAVTIAIYFVWNARTLYKLRKRNPEAKDVLFDNEKYFELKYKSEFLIATFTVAITAFGFIGYSSIDKISNELREQVSQETSGIDTISSTIENLSKRAKESDSISNVANNLSKRTEDNLKELNEKINLINNKNILKENFYVVNNLYFDRRVDKSQKKIFYRDLMTTSGDRLPRFTSPPSIAVSSFGIGSFTVINVTKESFYIKPIDGDIYTTQNDTFYFALVLFP